jgi:hypothetical protein
MPGKPFWSGWLKCSRTSMTETVAFSRLPTRHDFIDMGDDYYGYWMTSGTLTITSLTKDRAAGTFSASGIGFDGTDDDVALQLKNGKFDVQVMDMSDLEGGFWTLNAT